MVSDSHKELHQFVDERAGDAYRTAFHYDADDWEAMHVRSDLQTRTLGEEVPDIIERARETEALLREDDYPPIGETYATTEVHEDAIILHFPEGPDEGTLISLDPDAARLLTGFVTRCLSILQTPENDKYRTHATTE